MFSLGEGGEPLFFEVHGQLLPTVYALWRYPHALPALTTYSEVSPKVGEKKIERIASPPIAGKCEDCGMNAPSPVSHYLATWRASWSKLTD